MTIHNDSSGRLHSFAERRQAISNLRHMYSQAPNEAPFAFFIQDPDTETGKATPGGSNYKKLILNPNATSAEKQAQLLLFKDLIIGLQATKDSKTLFRSDVRNSIDAGQEPGQRIFNYRVIMLPPSQAEGETRASKSEAKPIKENPVTKQNLENIDEAVQLERDPPPLVEEIHTEEGQMTRKVEDDDIESLEIGEDDFVDHEVFEQIFMQTLHPQTEEAIKAGDIKEEDENVEQSTKTHLHDVGEQSSKPNQTNILAAKTRNLAMSAFSIDHALNKATENKKRFNQREIEKDELAAEKKREYIKSDEKKGEIKKSDLKASSKNKTVNKEMEANVEFNDAISKGKNPSLPSKFKLPGS